MAAVQFGHDYLGRVTSVTNGAMTTSLEYNNAGQLERESYSGGPLDGLSVSNSFDSLLRLQTVGVWQGGNLVASNSFTYDTASRLLTVSAGAFTGTYSYWPMSSLLSNIAFSYSGTNRLTTTRTYDGLDRLTGISSVPSASSAVGFSYGYNQANQRVAVTNADNSRWEHGYDFLGQVTNGVRKWSANSAVAGQQFGYSFDDIGNRLWTTRDGHQTDYANNDLNQITGRTVPGYANVLGSATNASKVTVNHQATDRKGDYFFKELAVTNSAGPVWLAVTNLAVLNKGTNADIIATNIGGLYIPPASESLTYDADGNLTSDGRWDNGWDAENRLTSQETTEAAVAARIPKEKLDHAYDWRWRRIQKTVAAWSGTGWTNAYQRKFVYEGWNLQAELDGSGNLVHSFVWGNDVSGSRQGAGGVGGLLAMIVHQGTNAGVYFYCYDGSHRIAALVDTNGIVLAQYEYGPFLELLRATGPLARENPFLGTSKYYDWETGLYYYGYRYYDPSTGRWLSRDPVKEPSLLMATWRLPQVLDYLRAAEEDGVRSDTSEYDFVGNDSLRAVDPWGLWSWEGGKRQGGSRARILSERGDTVRSLALKVRLDQSESAKWLKDERGLPVSPSATIKENCPFTVPNTIVVVVAGNLNTLVENAALMFANQVITRANQHGFRVVFLHHANSAFNTATILQYMDSDLWGITMYGHGVLLRGYLAVDSAYEFKKSDLPSHKLGLIIAKMCSSYYHDWDSRVSQHGAILRGGLVPLSFMSLGPIRHKAFVLKNIK